MDFALDPSLDPALCKVVELNHPAPIASGCLFTWEDPTDRACLLGETEFELRLRHTPSQVTSAPPAVVKWMAINRRKNKGARTTVRHR